MIILYMPGASAVVFSVPAFKAKADKSIMSTAGAAVVSPVSYLALLRLDSDCKGHGAGCLLLRYLSWTSPVLQKSQRNCTVIISSSLTCSSHCRLAWRPRESSTLL